MCKANEFRCGSSLICIDDSKVCDRHPDCPHGEDENNCGEFENLTPVLSNICEDVLDVVSSRSVSCL